jgi:hypothetical protein
MASHKSTFRAGAASVCITPDEPLWLAGYAARTAPARGKLSDLYASALAMDDATGERFVLVSVDVIAITPIIAEVVLETARFHHGLTRRQIILAPSHTHYGPEFRPDKAYFFNIPDDYAAKLPIVANRIAAAINAAIDRALAQLEPVRLYARKTDVGFAHNRRRVGAASRAVQRPPHLGGPTSEDIVDHEVPVLDCIDATGKRKAVMFGYACHNTTIPPADLRYCADWAGFAKEKLQQLNPGATALFICGAGADQDPEPHGSVELSRQHGNELADAVQSALERPGVEIAGPIQVEIDDVEFALTPLTRQQLEAMASCDDPPQRAKSRFLLDKLARGEKLITSYYAPVQVIRFGNELMMIALSGEPVVDWAHKFKKGARSVEPGAKSYHSDSVLRTGSTMGGSTLVWVAGYCNDMFGYLPTRRVQMEGGYEGGRANLWSWIPAPFTDDVEDRITRAVYRLLNHVCK